MVNFMLTNGKFYVIRILPQLKKKKTEKVSAC